MISQIKNKNYKRHKIEKQCFTISEDLPTDSQVTVAAPTSISLETLLDDDTLFFLRNAIVSEQLETIKDKLKTSIDLRQKIIRLQGFVIADNFPFYFVDHNLVNLFFFLI